MILRAAKLPSRPRAVITGAASGLGRALSLEIARRSGRVLVCDLHAERGAETVALVERAGGEAAFLACDVGEAADLERAADEADRRWGGTDLLVNNAGVGGAGVFGEIPLGDWEWMVRVNLFGVIYGCHAFVPRMKKAGRGFILNVASNAGIACLPEMSSYNTTKAAVIALSETLHTELADQEIAVTVLCPTFFPTNLMESFRSPTNKHREVAEQLFRRSSTTAEAVAAEAIRGLEEGRPLLIPQADGRFIWRTKRMFPNLYHRVVLGQAARLLRFVRG